jgi:hypothetical protein
VIVPCDDKLSQIVTEQIVTEQIDLESFLPFLEDSRGEERIRRQKEIAYARCRSSMPYSPYWFELLDCLLPWIVPAIALASLWMARAQGNESLQRTAERMYFAAMLVVAGVTLRTVLADDGCWIVHTSSLGLMVLAVAIPRHVSGADGMLPGPIEF